MYPVLNLNQPNFTLFCTGSLDSDGIKEKKGLAFIPYFLPGVPPRSIT
jgi:hypothetical protein